MNAVLNLSRREILKAGAGLTGALLLGFRFADADQATATAGPDAVFNPNAWLEITPDNIVTIYVPWTELGQGVTTAVPMLLADELAADWQAIEIKLAHNDPRFGGMGTGGSRSVRSSWDPVRQAGAAARTMLIGAAAKQWQVSEESCRAENGNVVHAESGKQLTFGELATAAALIDLDLATVKLKSRAERTLIGKNLPRRDIRDKVLGKTAFGCDQQIKDMVYATLAVSPVFEGTLKSFDDSAARRVPGVLQVVETPSGVAVIADGTWAAIQGREALKIDWEPGPHQDLDSATISAKLAAATTENGQVMREDGDTLDALATAAQQLAAVYELPYISHSPLEPMNCTARIIDDQVEVWAPIQSVSWGAGVAAQAAGVPVENVRLQPTYTGGGFGRRLMVDYVKQCVEIAKVSGRPVQLFWTREDTTQHGFYRPASRHTMKAGVDTEGQITAWQHHLAAPSISGQLNPSQMKDGRDEGAVGGASDIDYTFANLQVIYSMVNTAVPTGWLRSVYNTQNALANECFLDEIATATGVDPIALRLQHLPPGGRLANTLRVAAKAWGWPQKPAAGLGHGVACHTCFGSYVTTMVEVKVEGPRIEVTRVLSCVDCGPVVHPDGLRSQIEGAVCLALSMLLHEEITIAGGKVVETNFDDYPILKMNEMPPVEVVTIDSEDPIGGIGEPGFPPVGPAVLNAIYAATGQRVRKLPVVKNYKG